jgi:hypothetical protein
MAKLPPQDYVCIERKAFNERHSMAPPPYSMLSRGYLSKCQRKPSYQIPSSFKWLIPINQSSFAGLSSLRDRLGGYLGDT